MTGTLCNFGLNVGGLDLVDWYWFMDIFKLLISLRVGCLHHNGVSFYALVQGSPGPRVLVVEK